MFIEKNANKKNGVMGMKTTTTKWFSTCTRIRTLKTKTPLNLNQTTQQNNGKWGPKICKKNSPKQCYSKHGRVENMK